MNKNHCKAKENGQVKRRGKPSLEWKDNNDKPHYYCYGYYDCSTEELLPICKECMDNIIHSQKDLQEYLNNIAK